MTPDLLRYTFAALTCYRLAQLLAYDDGPMFIFARLRDFADNRKVREEANGKLRGPWASFNDLVSCPFCAGLWMALGCLGLVMYPSQGGDLFLVWGGIAGAQAFLQGRQGN